MILLRVFLIGLIVYLILKPFIKKGQAHGPLENSDTSGKPETRKISKSIGDYVDYEELKEDKK